MSDTLLTPTPNTRLVIDPVTRTISPKYKRQKAVYVAKGDHNSVLIAFEMPRYVDGYDMSAEENHIQIHYANISEEDNTKHSKGFSNAVNVQVETDEATKDEIISFCWLIPNTATKYAGVVSIGITFERYDTTDGDPKEIYSWSTAPYGETIVWDSMDNTAEAVERDYNYLIATCNGLVTSMIQEAIDSGMLDGVSTYHSWDGTVLTVTSASGTSSANLKGKEGNEGFSPSAKVTSTPMGAYIEVTDKNGTTSAPVLNGKDGVGIANVENRVPSDESGGDNLIWVTLTDGSVKTFAIKNGKDGKDGNDGNSDSATYLNGYDFAYVFNNEKTIKDFVTNREDYFVNYASGAMMLTPIAPTPYLYHTFNTPIDGSKCRYIKISYRFNRMVASDQEVPSTICFKTKQNPNFDSIHDYNFNLTSKTSGGGNERFTVILPMGTGLNWSQGTITDIRLRMPNSSMVSLDTLYIYYIGFFQNLADAEAYEPTKTVKVVQSTGNSETAVMSQKAVTDLFSSALGRVDADVTGSAIFIDDMSPVFDELKVTVSGDFSHISKEIIRCYGKNILATKDYAGTVGETVNVSGVDITRNADDTYTVNGTATENITYKIVGSAVPKNANIFLSGCPKGGTFNTYYLRHSQIGYDYGDGKLNTITGTDGSYASGDLTINIKSGTTVNNLTFIPQLELGSQASEYEKPIYTAVQCTVNTDGTVTIPKVIRPNMSIVNVTANNLQINCKYIRDFGKVLNNLNEQVASISNQLLN